MIGKVTMMDAGMRVAAACTVLLGGILVAMLFRHDSPQLTVPPAETDDRLVLRRRLEPPRSLEEATPRLGASNQRATSPPPPMPMAGREPALLKPTSLRPLRAAEPPPILSRDYPGDAAADVQNWSATSPSRTPLSRASAKAARTHKIADGDTLRILAQRYLGSADQFLQIYEANRDRLPSPEVLPIGVELRIPARQGRNPSPSNLMPKRPLVPVAGGEGS